MVSAPADTPLTTPALLTVAEPLDAVHVPPLVASARVIGVPMHTVDAPLIAPTAGVEVTVKDRVAVFDPHAPVTV